MDTTSDTDSATSADEGARPSRGIQSVEVGGQLLKALVQNGRAMALKDLARTAGMAPAKAHPYLVSFGKLGLIDRDELSGHYRLGPLALQMGLISLQQVDPVRLVLSELPAIAAATQCTVSAAVWGDTGPVIVGVEPGPGPVHVSMRHGMPASLRHTGTGQVFAAFAPPAAVARALALEGQADALTDAAFQQTLQAIRSTHLCRVQDSLIPGVSAMATPVFDGQGRLALAIAAIGPSALMDMHEDAALAQTLRQTSQQLSARLGYVAPAQTTQR